MVAPSQLQPQYTTNEAHLKQGTGNLLTPRGSFQPRNGFEEHALAYARRGIPVFRLRARTKEPFHGSRGFYDATTDPDTIRRWWTATPTANIGLPTGRASGIMVLDVDTDKGGADSLTALEAEHGKLPATWTVKTGGDNYQLYLKAPDENIRISAGKLGPGLDIRCDGGYVVAPPSIHPSGDRYTVHTRAPMVEPPSWLLALLKDDPKPAGETTVNTQSNQPISADLDGDPIPDGKRNEELTRIAGRLRARGAGDGELPEMLERINATRCNPPLPEREVQRIARSAMRWPVGSSKPGPDEETLEELAEIAAGVGDTPWPGMGGKSRRDVMVALILTAREHGERIPAGVRVSIGIRPLALKAGLSRASVEKAIRWLREHGYLRRDDGERSGTEAGALVLVSPPRAKVGHSATYREAIEPREGLVSYPCAPPYSAPRLRWSAPEYEGRERVGTLYRLGKTAGAVVDALEAAGGTLTLSEIADALQVSRPRDLRRRVLVRLEAASVVECSEDTVSLAADWTSALEDERERAGEIAAYRRDMARYARESEAYRNRHTRPVDPAPTEEEMAVHRETKPERRREAIETAVVELFSTRPVYRARRPGQIACALTMYGLLPEPFPRGVDPGGVPTDAEIETILEESEVA